MKINNVSDIKKLNDALPWIVGVWVTSYMRSIPAYLFSKFSILCFKESTDNEVLGELCEIKSLQKEGHSIKKNNTVAILWNSVSQQYLQEKTKYLLTYSNTKELEEIAEQLRLTVLHNAADLRWEFENKKTFREHLKSRDVKLIPWKNISLEDFSHITYEEVKKDYGSKIVLQLPDILKWWWKSTIFINNLEDRLAAHKKIMTGEFKGIKVYSVNITKFITWESSSITCCNTKYWTFCTNIQKQLIDIPEAINTTKWSWLFCWHDWSSCDYTTEVEQQAQDLGKKIGEKMSQMGYKWIFGLDIIIDDETGEVYPIECNARFTGAFPMISDIDLRDWVIPMDILHICELLEIEYTINNKELQKDYRRKKEGSHIIISNKKEESIICTKDMKTGIYQIDWEQISFVKKASSYKDFTDDNQFLIIDGNPSLWKVIYWYKKESRIAHVLFPKGIHSLDMINNFIQGHFESASS